MPHGYTRRQIAQQVSLVTRSPSVDAFGRLRVSLPMHIFSSQFTYTLQDLLYEQIVSGSGADISYDTTNRTARYTFASSPNGSQAYMQTFEHFRYQPSKAQQYFITFNFEAPAANCIKSVGASDGTNGIELRQNGSIYEAALLSTTSVGNQIVTQVNWNLDRLDGSGTATNPSGIVIDLTKQQIFTLDFQALYSGRVRLGLDIDGEVVYFHEFRHANIVTDSFIQTANLPVRVGMTCIGTVSTTMHFTCAAVIAGGGEDIHEKEGFNFVAEGVATANNNTRTHLLSLRPRSTFNGIVNRAKFLYHNIEVLVTGTNPVLWELVLGQAITGSTSFNDVHTTESIMAFNNTGTISGSPFIVIASGYCPASATMNSAVSTLLTHAKYPITLNAAGNVRPNGTLSLLVTGLGGASACRGKVAWREVR